MHRTATEHPVRDDSGLAQRVGGPAAKADRILQIVRRVAAVQLRGSRHGHHQLARVKFPALPGVGVVIDPFALHQMRQAVEVETAPEARRLFQHAASQQPRAVDDRQPEGGQLRRNRSDDPVHLAAAAVESVIGNDRFIHVQRSCFRV